LRLLWEVGPPPPELKGVLAEVRQRLILSLLLSLAVFVAGAPNAGASAKVTPAERTMIKARVPTSFASTCVGSTSTFRREMASVSIVKSYAKTLLVSVSCYPTGQGQPNEVTYQEFKTVKAMNGLYVIDLTAQSLKVGENATSNTCPKEGGYHIGSSKTTAGDYACSPSTSKQSAVLLWTNNSLKILSVAIAKTDPTGSLLLGFFAGDSGPR